MGAVGVFVFTGKSWIHNDNGITTTHCSVFQSFHDSAASCHFSHRKDAALSNTDRFNRSCVITSFRKIKRMD